MHRGFTRSLLATLALVSLPSPGRAGGPRGDAGPFPEGLLEGNVVAPPFSRWGSDARRVFKRDVRHAAYPAEIHYDLALWFFERGEYESSLSHYRRAAEIDPDFPEAYFGIGLLFYTLGDDDNAARYYEQALSKDPGDPDIRNNLGLIYYRKGELSKARREIEEALRLQPNFPDALYNLGLVFYQQKELRAAREQFETALRQDPTYLRARFNLGVVYYELGLQDLAEEQWSRIESTAPGTTLAQQATENLTIIRAVQTPP